MLASLTYRNNMVSLICDYMVDSMPEDGATFMTSITCIDWAADTSKMKIPLCDEVSRDSR